ncbi:MAG: DNA polymerase III subunit epsilon [Alphaproteobacteria bacterium]|nr:DNA polymerase III subunit epsilon [Alphaproteobacteria bacterium]
MREIVFDTETTGLDPFSGDKLVEIGAVELINHIPTGKEYHQYINPMRSIDEEVVKVHGLTEEFLSDKPTFEEICDDFLAFIGSDSYLVAHNAPFDMKFLNCQLRELNKEQIDDSRVIDTVPIARKKFPGSRVNLDELCRRFGVDNSKRTVHGALLDAQLLADVYLELLGGHEPGLLSENTDLKNTQTQELQSNFTKKVYPARHFEIPENELENHNAFLQKIKDALWMADNKGDVLNEAEKS